MDTLEACKRVQNLIIRYQKEVYLDHDIPARLDNEPSNSTNAQTYKKNLQLEHALDHLDSDCRHNPHPFTAKNCKTLQEGITDWASEVHKYRTYIRLGWIFGQGGMKKQQKYLASLQEVHTNFCQK